MTEEFLTIWDPVIAYKMPEDSDAPDDVVCNEADCLSGYADLLQRAKALTQEDVNEMQSDREGRPMMCCACGTYLDTFTRSGAP